MELWVAGFNGWGQLIWGVEQVSESHDIDYFRCAVQDHFLKLLWTSPSATLLQTSSRLQISGYPDQLTQLFLKSPALCASIAIAGNDKIAEYEGSQIKEFLSTKHYLKQNGLVLGDFEEIVQITANQTTFTALSKTGKVWSWGDGRYEACLGREVTEKNPTGVPSLIQDLLDLPTGPIKKIASGGYVTAALTAGNDLYIWGGRPSQQKLLKELSAVPMPTDLDGEDVQDVAIGVNHMLAITVTNRLFVVGSGGNGQLGSDYKQLREWQEVVLPLKENQHMSKVHAGYKCSFIIVEES